MSVCPACRAELRPGDRFCSQCGEPQGSVCPNCGAENTPGNRFCPECGASLSGASDPASAPVSATASERRLVSVLFADLVGFTTLSEHRDPEEVRELLSQYFERCRSLIERHGGTVEKFIGDAVMAVWGTPVAREDDAERSVRAALALTGAVTALGQEVGMPELRVRAGVLTGSAAVEVGAEGEGMVLGDSVNTASRLQSIAAPGTVLVDDVTRRASEAAIAYEDAGEHEVKGREQPVHAWTALRVVAGAGGARRSAGLEAPFVGRDAELRTIIAVADDTVANRTARLVTVTGDAGTGKSRLLWEFFKYVDGIEEVRWWHQGRCLSYGDGVAYWALAEMVRARAGIVEEEDEASSSDKLRATIERFVTDERERRLVEPRLAQLLGLEESAAREAGDLFSGWRLFFERMADTEPVILAFEDLQWADSGLLDFIDYLLEWSADYPIFMLALGRSELDARRPDWGTSLRLEPLAPAAMQAVLDGLVPGLPADLTERILGRAEGVPLYAVETVRMLLDRGLLAQDGSRYVVAGAIENLEVPETLQALMAARLDNLEASERSLLQDAAVLGISFAPGALAAVSERREADVRRALDTLVTKQVVGRDDDQRSGEQGQYHFLQALLRTIALGTLSRRDRKARHLAAAEHLRATSGDAPEIAEVLASHYLEAVAAEPDAPDAASIRDQARTTLIAAGHRAVSLALGAEARAHFERAAELTDDHVQRSQLLAEAGSAAARTGDTRSAERLLSDAITNLDSHQAELQAAATRVRLAEVLTDVNRLEQASVLLAEAGDPEADPRMRAEIAACRAQIAFLRSDFKTALDDAELALSIADPRGITAVVAPAAMTKGIALYFNHRLTEAGAMMELGLQVALDADLATQTLRAYYNLADLRVIEGRGDESTRLIESGLALAREQGNRVWERNLLAQRAEIRIVLGEWDGALVDTATLRSGGEDEGSETATMMAPVVHAARGSQAPLEELIARGRERSEWHELAALQDAGRGIALVSTGHVEEGIELLAATVPWLAEADNASCSVIMGDVVENLLNAGRHDLVREVVHRREHRAAALVEHQLAAGRAGLHVTEGEYQAAENGFRAALAGLRRITVPFPLARCLLQFGSLLIDQGRAAEAEPLLREAHALFTELRATPWIRRTETLLAPVAAAS